MNYQEHKEHNVLWNRMRYLLSPQFDTYEQVARIVRGKVADIGFGTGFGAHLLELNAKEVYGYEIDEEAIRFAQRVFPFKSLHFQYGDIVTGITGVSFDYVIMIDVLEHIKKDIHALKNVKGMLNKGGTFVCSTPNRLSRYRKAETHYREYAPKEFEGILKRTFVSVSLQNYRFEPLASDYENPILAICRNED
jgi:2-polyprenyl-3-methyl-5-hydroxy-6-metoxy-1,4-benzoquinol methylase